MKFIIEVNVFSVSCVCFKEIFSVHYGKCIQLTQNETYQKAIFYVFDLSKWTKTCITTVVHEVALDVQSVKVSEYPFRQNRSMLKNKTAIMYMFL